MLVERKIITFEFASRWSGGRFNQDSILTYYDTEI